MAIFLFRMGRISLEITAVRIKDRLLLMNLAGTFQTLKPHGV
jgi:hypothetical protein